MAVLAEFRRKAEETRELQALSPGSGEGNCRRFVVIDTSHSDLTVSAVPRSVMRLGCLWGAAPVTPRSALSGITRTGRPFDASEQQTGQHRWINEPRAVGISVGLCRISIACTN